MKAIKHILIVDDDRRIRDLLEKYLIENGFFISSAEDAAQARERLKKYQFDLMVLDVMMPGETGIELTASLRKESDVPIIMLTAMGEIDNRIEGLESGADDYLPKPFEPKELLLRINNILQRLNKVNLKKDIVHFGGFTFSFSKNVLLKGNKEIDLTDKELELLKVLIGSINNIVNREKLVEVFGNINERTIDVIVTRLRNKIESNPKKPVYLRTVRGKGYLLRES